jgi:hypothetical protein
VEWMTQRKKQKIVETPAVNDIPNKYAAAP